VTNVCRTVSGPNTGAPCVLPFIYKGIQYDGCTTVDGDNGQPWCSTQVDNTGTHVGGAGQYGNCGPSCDKHTGTTSVSVAVAGEPASVGLDQIPWFPKDGTLHIPLGVDGVDSSQITNSLLSSTL
jgi:hypothetical protein